MVVSTLQSPAHQLQQQEVAGGVAFLVLEGEVRHLVEEIGGKRTELMLNNFRGDDGLEPAMEK